MNINKIEWEDIIRGLPYKIDIIIEEEPILDKEINDATNIEDECVKDLIKKDITKSSSDSESSKNVINSKIHAVKDSYVPLLKGSVKVGKGVASAVKPLNVANKVLTPIGIAADTYRTARAIYSDINYGTSRNTVETVSSMAGGWGGGYGGALAGAAVGSALLPGLGTIIGGIVGGLSGGISGAIITHTATKSVSDLLEYNIRNKNCLNCGQTFKGRDYVGENICIWCQQDNFILYILKM
ncbi:uncharacterized protein C13G5.2-like [Condylostylus longicornis]|uniref:uncharacterized protein C13G5.2-like n=1 Tax=Condylostylus longicornis TaxID=2530218 RepID=UPI00244E3911|nr:uncharacterized protein C13G5.2-like [Condylostylus longicornis]XP_055377591.1 uncharacterized protein C13G5.2-like [Condylostylus longicornis]